jgi:hypothetical protein
VTFTRDENAKPTVGIRMSGKVLPADLPLVIDVFIKHGCPRDLAWRVAEELSEWGSRRTRLLPIVDLAALEADLGRCGITLEVGEFP